MQRFTLLIDAELARWLMDALLTRDHLVLKALLATGLKGGLIIVEPQEV